MAPAKKGPTRRRRGHVGNGPTTGGAQRRKGKSMTRTLRLSSIVVAFLLAIPVAARAQKKHKGADPAPAQPTEGLKFKPDPVGKGAPAAATGPASKTLERALKLYESEDYYSASIELHKV